MLLRIMFCYALAAACFAQEIALDVQAFLPEAATLKQQMSLTGDRGSAMVLVYSSQDESNNSRHSDGIRILKYDPDSGWAVAYEETHATLGRHDQVSVERLFADDGPDALLVITVYSGAGTATNWHVLAAIDGTFTKLDPAAERAKALSPREYVDNGYNSVKPVDGRIVETLPGYTRGRARCCPNRPRLEMTFGLTGGSITLSSVKELRHPAAPPVLDQPLLRTSANGLWSYGYALPNGFLVLEGGQSPKIPSPTTPESIVALRRSLVEQGVLFDYGDYLSLTQNYEFTSSSVAAGVMLARPTEGATEWKHEHGQ